MTPVPPRIRLLGRVRVHPAGGMEAAIVPSGRRAEVVLAVLVHERARSVSRDELAEALWPVALPDTWNAALRGVLSEVRRVLDRAGLPAADALVTEQGRLRLVLPPEVVVDLDEARAALEAARAELAAGRPAEAAPVAARASAAFAQPFLDFHDEGWAADRRRDLDRLLLEAIEIEATALAAAGDPRAALEATSRLLRVDPLREAAHRLQITLLGATGDRAGALQAYERCAALLDGELGITPSAETETALRDALTPPPAPGGSAQAGSVPGADDAPAPEPSAPVELGRLGVLVVEDHDFQRRTTLALLRGLGVHDLQEAADGLAALALLDARPPAPDVIVCDLDMPGMDGVEFIRNVAERRLASAVVIASGLDERVLDTVRAASEGYGLQVLGAVGKPLTTSALASMLATYRPRPRAATAPAAPHARLAAALDAGTLAARFTPVIDLAVGRVAGVRVTAATQPGDGAQEPTGALDGASPELGRRLLEHLLRSALPAARELGLALHLPLPAPLLTDVTLADTLAAIQRDGVVLVADARALTERDRPAMLDALARLRVKGYGLAADGFAPGPLERLPLTHLQLPEALVERSLSGEPGPLDAAVDGARRLGIPMIGRCSSAAQFDLLLQIGCSSAHGPFLAPAVGAAELAAAAGSWTAPPVPTEPRP